MSTNNRGLLSLKGVPQKHLGDVVLSIKTGLNPRQNFKLNEGGAKNYYVTVKEISNNKAVLINSKTAKITGEALGLINERSNLEKGDVLFSGTGTVGRVVVIDETPTNWNINESIYAIKLDQEQVVPRYLMYLFHSRQIKESYRPQITGSTVKSMPITKLKGLSIPIPPMQTQLEIVRMLDSFTGLEAELEAELEARRKQNEYYRNELLTFDKGEKAERERERVRWLTLGDIGKVSMCRRVFKNQTTPSGDIPFYKIGTFGKSPDAYISRKLYDEYRKAHSYPKRGDILISASGTIGRTVVFDGKPAYFQDSNIVWVDNDESIATNKFLFHAYKRVAWKTEGGTIKRLYNDNLKKIEIPVPPLDEQKRIASILDKFEKLIYDISEGLPAELNARRQQYEYYRDKLLTFQGLAA